MKINSQKNCGQALVEYLIVFMFMILITVKMVASIRTMMGTMVGTLGFVLSDELKVGVCEKDCFLKGYRNQ
jgi:hypothetical protein